MKARRYILAGLVSVSGLYGPAWAQIPAAPAAIAGPPVAAIPAAPAPTTLWSFLGISAQNCEDCKRKLCAKPCGQLISQAMTPLTTFSGGIINPFCPLMPSAAELADQGGVGAAAKVKADEAGAKARRAAMRYLGTVDCHYWPEAEDALIGGLRGDRNECVRFEAAVALGNGCCCTKKTMEALRIAMSCSDTDGNPKETSDRVRAAAVSALEHCLACYVAPPVPVPPKIPEGKRPEGAIIEKPIEGEELKGPPKTSSNDNGKTNAKVAKAERPKGMAYYAKIDEVPRDLIVDEARKSVAKYNEKSSARAVLAGQNSLVQLIDRSNGPATDVYTSENGVPIPRAEIISPRPSNLWDMLARQVPASGPTVNYTAAPPLANNDAMAKAVVEPMPLSNKFDPMPMIMPEMKNEAKATVIRPMPQMSKAAPPVVAVPEMKSEPKAIVTRSMTPMKSALPLPEPVRILTPAEAASSGSYGQTTVIKPRSMAQIQPVMPAKEATDHLSLKPSAEAPKVGIKVPPMESKMEFLAVAPTAMASRALKVLVESHPAAVREQVAEGLTSADLASCPELAPALIDVARGTDAETTRKAAIRALVRTGTCTPAVIGALDKMTDDPSPSVRVEAAIGMARLKVKAGKN